MQLSWTSAAVAILSPSLKGSLYKPYPDSLKKTLHKLSSDEFISPSLLMETDQLLGRFYSDCCLALLDQHELQPHQIHAIGSHGQTIRHKPAPDGFSLQIGDAHLIAELTGITTVSDFRRRDIAAGGQGAPLVPAFHHDVFHSVSETRQILNLGGIANITVLSDKTFGFDTGPANTLMNDWVKQHWGQDFDSDGNYARSGKIHHDLLSEWLKLPYFGQHPPKSTGRELFNLHNLKQITPEIDQLKKEDILASLTELTAVSVSDAVKAWGSRRRRTVYLRRWGLRILISSKGSGIICQNCVSGRLQR